jgi:hypothetical protein
MPTTVRPIPEGVNIDFDDLGSGANPIFDWSPHTGTIKT